MPLTPDEQAEFAQLHQKFGNQSQGQLPAPQQAQGGLTPSEQQELEVLKAKFGPGPQQSKPKNLMAYAPSENDIKSHLMRPSTVNKPLGQNVAESLPMIGGLAGSLVGPGGTGLGAWIGTAALGALGAGAGSMAKNLATNDQAPPQQAISNVAHDALYQGALPAVGGKAIGLGISKMAPMADNLMQHAMGMKKFIPGAGKTAIDQGIRGSESQMTSQMGNALNTEGQNLDSMVGKLQGEVDPEAVASRVADYGQKYMSPGGMATDVAKERVGDAGDRAANIYNRWGEGPGPLAPTDARAMAQSAEKAEGYSFANSPKQNFSSELARQEGQGYRDQLRDMGDAQDVPVRNQFEKMYHLLKGNTALNAPKSVSTGSSLKDFLNSTLRSPWAESNAAKALDATGETLSQPGLNNFIKQAPRLRPDNSRRD